ncbi:hypothetical protein A2791_04660 [Candidatus Saccharibacteria bacterium RIFCSPHIGHO2_01_FULL_46_30]|nr:MAG: hypothetical protein A2791_04660 [Candidatus Saccharibacteria bacterium RIFCSPHIGHO2_01_FULL_46_30]
MTNQLTNYIPGVCNINPVEIRRRRQAGHIGLVLSVVVIVGLIALHTPWYLRLVAFLPLFLSATGYLQARHKFCVGYASAGMQHADDDSAALKIDDASMRKADTLKARMINLQAFLITAVITGLIALLPL